jgi:hypothetical protein
MHGTARHISKHATVFHWLGRWLSRKATHHLPPPLQYDPWPTPPLVGILPLSSFTSHVSFGNGGIWQWRGAFHAVGPFHHFVSSNWVGEESPRTKLAGRSAQSKSLRTISLLWAKLVLDNQLHASCTSFFEFPQACLSVSKKISGTKRLGLDTSSFVKDRQINPLTPLPSKFWLSDQFYRKL